MALIIENNPGALLAMLCDKYFLDRRELGMVLRSAFESLWKWNEYQKNLHVPAQMFALIMAMRQPEVVRRYLNQLVIFGALTPRYRLSQNITLTPDGEILLK